MRRRATRILRGTSGGMTIYSLKNVILQHVNCCGLSGLRIKSNLHSAVVKAATREPLHLTRDVRANRDSTAPWLEGEQDPRWHTPGVRTFKLNTRGLFRPSCKEVTLPFLWRYEGALRPSLRASTNVFLLVFFSAAQVLLSFTRIWRPSYVMQLWLLCFL